MEARDFRPTEAQRRLFEEGGPRRMLTGWRSGRRAATEGWIRVRAADARAVELALTDLNVFGVAMLDGDGRRVPVGSWRPRFTVVRFDEEPR